MFINKRKNGFTLVEILAAFSIICIALIPIMTTYSAVFKMTKDTGKIDDINRTMDNVAEYIRAKGYDNLEIMLADETEKTFPSYDNYYNLTKIGYYYSDTNFENDFNFSSNFFKLNTKEIDLSTIGIQVGVTKIYFYSDPNFTNALEGFTPVIEVKIIIKDNHSNEIKDSSFVVTPLLGDVNG